MTRADQSVDSDDGPATDGTSAVGPATSEASTSETSTAEASTSETSTPCPSAEDHVAWDGGSAAVARIREAVLAHAPVGALRVVLQRLALHEQGRAVGVHESLDVILDVEGNLVAMSIEATVREDPDASARLDRALSSLRAEVADDLGTEPDSLEVVLDADGERRVLVVLSTEVTPLEIAEHAHHRALHDGHHHITHHAPALDELRDRMAAQRPGPLRRTWNTLTAGLRPSR